MPHLTRRTLFGAAAGLGAAPMLTNPARAQQRPGVIRMGLSAWPPNLQPWPSTGASAGTVKMLIHRRLMRFDEKGELQGELASEYSRDAEGAWVFKLRPDAVFHNGEKVTAEDVKWCIEQIAAERSTAYYRTQMQQIERVETPDPHTVRLVMKAPNVTAPLWFANYNMAIVWRGSRDMANAIGCGPYRVASQERGTWIQLEKANNYWVPGLPRTPVIRMVVYADENLRLAALQSGDVDMVEYVPWSGMAAVENDPRLKLDAQMGPFMDILFNGTRPPFNNPLVRRAVAHAVKREDIVRVAFSGRGKPIEGMPIVEGTPWYDAELAKGHAYDPERAKALLTQAGFPNGFSTTLLATSQFGMHKDSAEISQQYLAAIGIQAELRLTDWSTRVSAGIRGQYDIAVHGVSADFNDPDGLTVVLDTSLSDAHGRSFRLSTPRTVELLAKGRTEFDQAKRIEIYKDMQRAALEEVPVVALAWREQGYGFDRRITGFTNLPGALTTSSGALLEFAAFG
ncbi:ABC transporter substrate-binding protein [Falsiroseomonas sp.]|uniref:ABC transporter substrate-binding protein n=1 Tax=Falsiroseomonas sp. TaxID=2870721 RepID=UPI0027367373|nr:ABC transporter substrate-binding protein [Falsiroseomonas sp.]MDP3414686.1 ABC transporter substrate-binding protein [Falsiroseomonas sp.]